VNAKFVTGIAAALFLIFVPHQQAEAATIWLGTPNRGGGGIIIISGELMYGDEKLFAAQAARMPEGFVSLMSPGGNVYAALVIGDEIRRRGFATYVGANQICASACSLIALSGRSVIVNSRAWLGFHMAFDDNGASPEGTAIVAAYLRRLGLTEPQVRYMTRAAPANMQWATQADARALGFQYQIIFCRGLIGAFCNWRSCQSRYCLWRD
jgi:hypothetical protein